MLQLDIHPHFSQQQTTTSNQLIMRSHDTHTHKKVVPKLMWRNCNWRYCVQTLRIRRTLDLLNCDESEIRHTHTHTHTTYIRHTCVLFRQTATQRGKLRVRKCNCFFLVFFIPLLLLTCTRESWCNDWIWWWSQRCVDGRFLLDRSFAMEIYRIK